MLPMLCTVTPSITNRRKRGESVYANDTFTDSNGTALSSHAMNIGSGWAALRGTWQIQGNRASNTATAGDDQCVASTECNHANVNISANITPISAPNPNVRLVCNIVDADNYWVGAASGTDTQIYEKTGGSFVLRASGVIGAITYNVTYPCTLKCNGNSVYWTCNGLSINSTVGGRNHQTATKQGIGAYGPNPCETDNFRVVPYS